jgi:ABC-type sugar transport system substrate-binding protein
MAFLGVSCKPAEEAVEEVMEEAEEAVEEVMEEAEEAVEEVMEEEMEEELFIGFLAHGPTTQNETYIRGGIHAAEDLGVKISADIPSAFDFEEMLNIYNGYIAQGVDGIVLFPYPEINWVVPVEESVNDGLPVFTVGITAPGIPETAHFGMSDYSGGIRLVEIMLEDFAEKGITEGTIAYSKCLSGIGSLEGRIAGIEKGLEQVPDTFDIVGFIDSTYDAMTNYDAYQNTYNAYPDLVAMLSVCDIDGPSIAKHIADTGAEYTGYVFDVMPESILGMETGSIGAMTGWHPYAVGYVAVMSMVEHLREGTEFAGWWSPGVELFLPETAEDQLKRDSDLEYERTWYKEWIDENWPDGVSGMMDDKDTIQYLQYFEEF